MSRARVSVKWLLSHDDGMVAEMIAELEAPRKVDCQTRLWTDRLTTSVKGGKGSPGGW